MTKIKDLTPDARNANKGTAKGQKLIVSSIQQNGFGRSGLIDKAGNIIAGNKTTEAAAEVFGVDVEPIIVETDGTRPVYVKRTDLDLQDPDPNNPARRLAYLDNLSQHFSFALDPEALMADLESGLDLEAMGLTLPDLSGLLEKAALDLLGGNGAGRDTEPQIDRAEELRVKWGVEVGDLWQLGQHRLICGDCTDKAVVKAIACGDRIKFIYIDPPYSVGYADKNAGLNAVAKGNSIQTPIENDHLDVKETSETIWKPAFTNLFDLALPGCVYYCSAPQGGDQMMMMMMALSEAGWLVKHEIIWVKNNHVLGRADYQYKHEPIIYGWKPGGGHYFIDSRSELSVWEINKPHNSDLYPTTKPLDLVERAMRNSSRTGDICADFFLGSGTTILAGENLGRKVLGVELTPGYCAVTLERWQTHTGQTPVKLTDMTPKK